jgi:uncharacterized protein YmfQ (DUF2313 family)
MGNVLRDNLEIIGEQYDQVEAEIDKLLNTEMWPQFTTLLLSLFEQAYGLSNSGSDSDRRARILTARRSTGGINHDYIEGLCNTFANGNYTVEIINGTEVRGFILGQEPQPQGLGTPLPCVLGNPNDQGSRWTFTVRVTGSIVSPLPELEALVKKNKPAWTIAYFEYL